MKKYLWSYGSLILYLLLVFNLDRVYYDVRLESSQSFQFKKLWIVMTVYYLIFVIISLVFINWANTIRGDDWKFHIFEILISLIFILNYPLGLTAYLNFFPFTYLRGLASLGVMPTTNFGMAMNFVLVLGVMGLWRGKFGKMIVEVEVGGNNE